MEKKMEEMTEDENLAIRFKKLKAQKESLEQEIEKLNKTYFNKIEKLSTENIDLKNNIKNIKLSHESETVLMSNGITDTDLADYIKFQYNKAPVEEGQERQSFADFFSSFKEVSPLLKANLQSAPEEVAVEEVSSQEALEVNDELASLKPETPAIDSSFKGTGLQDHISVGSITPRDFAKLSATDQDALFISMGLKR
jgi:maleate cis-trans isomerase